MWDPFAEFETLVLSNGLTVHVAHWPGRNWEAMGFVIHSGANQDPRGLEGTAHFLEHLVSSNTSYSLEAIRNYFSDHGGEVNLGGTNYSFTRYRFFIPAKHKTMQMALAMFGEMLLSARINNSIERERDIVTREFFRLFPNKCRFDALVRERAALFTNHIYRRSYAPLGEPDSILRISKTDLQDYYDAHYTPANMSAVCVGSFCVDEIKQLLEDSVFAVKKAGRRQGLPPLQTKMVLPHENRYEMKMSDYVHDPAEVGVYHTRVRLPGIMSAEALKILRMMLDEVLFQELRKTRAWTYRINTLLDSTHDMYLMAIDCDSFHIEAIDDFESVVDGCIASLGAKKDLFAQIKSRLLAKYNLLDVNGRGICGEVIGDLAWHQRITTMQKTCDDLQGVTLEDIREILQYLAPDHRWTLLIRP